MACSNTKSADEAKETKKSLEARKTPEKVPSIHKLTKDKDEEEEKKSLISMKAIKGDHKVISRPKSSQPAKPATHLAPPALSKMVSTTVSSTNSSSDLKGGKKSKQLGPAKIPMQTISMQMSGTDGKAYAYGSGLPEQSSHLTCSKITYTV